MVRLLARLLRAAGYYALTEQWEPRLDRPVKDRAGNHLRDRDGQLRWEKARLDLLLNAAPEEPITYGDVVVSHPGATTWERTGAREDGAVAEAAARRKHVFKTKQ